jgi:hypothetical protein
MSPTRARDIARAHMALAEQYHIAGMLDAGLEANRQARLWLAYSVTLKTVGSEPEGHGAP